MTENLPNRTLRMAKGGLEFTVFAAATAKRSKKKTLFEEEGTRKASCRDESVRCRWNDTIVRCPLERTGEEPRPLAVPLRAKPSAHLDSSSECAPAQLFSFLRRNSSRI